MVAYFELMVPITLNYWVLLGGVTVTDLALNRIGGRRQASGAAPGPKAAGGSHPGCALASEMSPRKPSGFDTNPRLVPNPADPVSTTTPSEQKIMKDLGKDLGQFVENKR